VNKNKIVIINMMYDGEERNRFIFYLLYIMISYVT
jgi:hypothetical protein